MLFAFIAIAPQAFAKQSDWAVSDQAKVRLISGNISDKTLLLGLEFDLKPGWKVYWRAPGDVGLPISVNLKDSKNISASAIKWPVPHRSVDFGTIESIGYKNGVLLPIVLTLKDKSADTHIDAKVNYAICNEICLNLDQDFVLDIKAGEADLASQKLIDEALRSVPVDESGDLAISEFSIAKSGEQTSVIIKAFSKSGFKDPDIFIEDGANFRFTKPAVVLSDDKKQATFTIPAMAQISGKRLTLDNAILTLVDNGKGVEKKISGKKIKKNSADMEFGLIILFAFLGGLILNLMPCVLPVLSIKLLSIIKHGGKSNIQIRASFMATSCGIIFSFLLLALIIAGFKKAGMAVGWGFHFQEPLFIISLILILLLFAANLFGYYEINVPGWLNRFVNRDNPRENVLVGHFLSGALATLLATPCTAPFLGTAISFALSSGITEIFVIFYFIGTGLAAPYIILILFPKLVSKMPKPGKWMIKVKYAMGGLLLLTVLWLLGILRSQLGEVAALSVLFSCAVFFAIYQYSKRKIENSRYVLRSIALAIVAAVALIFTFMPHKAEIHKHSKLWQDFDRPGIIKYVEQGRVVLVDVTADWCLTCKANEIRVLENKDIRKILQEKNVVMMRADWTTRNMDIADYLKSHNRFGIPFNVVYGPKDPQGIVLKELLTEEELESAIQRAE